MTQHEFKIWLAVNGYTQKSLAKRLGLTDRTVSTYATSGKFPIIFVEALKGLAK